MRHLVLGVVVAAVASSGVGGQSRSPLDSQVTHFRIPSTLPPCGIATAVVAQLAQLARTSRVLIGFERTSDCQGASSFPKLDATSDVTDLGGMTVRAALDTLMGLTPNYRWKEMDGVAVVRPAASWKDARNALNLQVQPFSIDNGTASEALAKILKTPTHNSPIDNDNRAFSMAFKGGTMVEALNALIRAHEGAVWDAGPETLNGLSGSWFHIWTFRSGEPGRHPVSLAGVWTKASCPSC